jgi:hypothetical protein
MYTSTRQHKAHVTFCCCAGGAAAAAAAAAKAQKKLQKLQGIASQAEQAHAGVIVDEQVLESLQDEAANNSSDDNGAGLGDESPSGQEGGSSRAVHRSSTGSSSSEQDSSRRKGLPGQGGYSTACTEPHSMCQPTISIKTVLQQNQGMYTKLGQDKRPLALTAVTSTETSPSLHAQAPTARKQQQQLAAGLGGEA